MTRRAFVPMAVLAAVAAFSSCGGRRSELLLASTTSTEDSGLFEVLIPAFELAHPEYTVRVTAVGTGQALELGRRRDADVLLVHAPAAESAFVAAGHGTTRCAVMYNDYVIVGPASDPAGIGAIGGPAGAFRRLAASRSPFISRGDDSGTHRKERSLWAAAGLEPGGRWYHEVGQGMAETLLMADEMRAYALADRATYLNLRRALELAVLVEGDSVLFNPYGVIPVTGASNPRGARAFAVWITGTGQHVIRNYGAARFGRPLFIPDAGGCSP